MALGKFKVEAGQVICSWFARCENLADGVVEHPILEYVPTCKADADKHDLKLITASFTVEN